MQVPWEEGKMQQEPSVDSSGSRFTPLVVVELASDTKEEAIAWLLSRIRDRQQNGGVDVRVYLFPAIPLFDMNIQSYSFCHFSQVLSCWWSSWALESGLRRRKTPTCSWWGLHGRGCSLVLRMWASSRSSVMDP